MVSKSEKEQSDIHNKYAILLKKHSELQKKYNILENTLNNKLQTQNIKQNLEKLKQKIRLNTKQPQKYKYTEDTESDQDSKCNSDSDSNSDCESDCNSDCGCHKQEKKPLSGYLLFSQEKRSEIIKNNPNFKVTEIAVKLGEMWKALSDEEKEAYKKINNNIVSK
jgi:hypothetical protein